MTDEEELPWDALLESEGEIPWEELREFAAALPGNPDLLEKLAELYDEEWSMATSHETYADLYIPAIIALAASEHEVKQEDAERWGRFLIERLLRAGEHERLTEVDVLSAACGTVGPVILPRLLERIDDMDPENDAWFHAWGLTEVVVDSEDEDIRRRVIGKCKQALHDAEQGDLSPLSVSGAAWALAFLDRKECVPLLRRVADMVPAGLGGRNGIAEAADYLENKLDYNPSPELWNGQIEDWFPGRVKYAKKRRRNQPSEMPP